MKRTLALMAPMLLTACGLSNLDRPASREEDNWVKPGFTRESIARVLYEECDYGKTRENRTFQEQVDNCMLGKGFRFVDNAWDVTICNKEPRKNFPSCRSLKK